MRRFLIVTGDFTPLGGMDAGNHALARYLAAQPNTEVHLVAHRIWPDLMGMPAVRFHRVPRMLNSNLLSAPLLAWRGKREAARLTGVRTIVNGGNCAVPDVNWVHYVHAAHKPESAGGPVRKAHTILAYRCYLAAERAILPAARMVVTNSNRTRADLISTLGVDGERIRTVYYGSDPTRFKPATVDEKVAARVRLGLAAAEPVAVFIGALGDRRKGFDTLFEAWRNLKAGGEWPVRLLVVGSGAELAAWKQRAAEEGLAGSVQFLGFRKDVPDILAAADLLVHPARYEAYGLAVQEALCCGLPALVSAHSGVAERYTTGMSGLLIQDPERAESLVDSLRRWLQNRTGMSEMVRQFSDQLRAYTWDKMAADFAAQL